jgi:hypothetical protein
MLATVAGWYDVPMRRLVALIAASTLVLAACGDDDDDDTTATTAAADGASASTLPVSEDEIVGATVEDASAALEAEGWTLRVVERDGEPQAATMDLVPTRVNVATSTESGTETVTAVVNVG